MAAGVVFGWPVLLGLALREVDAVHGALLSGLLPLATAALAAWLLGQRCPAGSMKCRCSCMATR